MRRAINSRRNQPATDVGVYDPPVSGTNLPVIGLSYIEEQGRHTRVEKGTDFYMYLGGVWSTA